MDKGRIQDFEIANSRVTIELNLTEIWGVIGNASTSPLNPSQKKDAHLLFYVGWATTQAQDTIDLHLPVLRVGGAGASNWRPCMAGCL